MKRLAGSIALALTAGTAGAQPPGPQGIFCAQLKRVVEVAELGGDFASLERSRAAWPNFGFRYGCRASGGARPSWYCHQSLAPDHLSLDSLAARTAACLPEAVRQATVYPRDEAVFTVPHARIRIAESGGPGAHVGRIVSFSVEAVAAK